MTFAERLKTTEAEHAEAQQQAQIWAQKALVLSGKLAALREVAADAAGSETPS